MATTAGDDVGDFRGFLALFDDTTTDMGPSSAASSAFNASTHSGGASGTPSSPPLATVSDGYKPPLISDYAVQFIYTINLAIVGAAVCVFGIATNAINIVVFARMKFRETINIALMGLAVSDLLSVTSLLWMCVCFNPLFMYSDVHIYTLEIQLKPGAWTHNIFTRITAFLTVYITLERCLCIAFPLKIKEMLTPKRVTTIIVLIYVLVIGSLLQNYFTIRFEWKFIPERNRTMIGMVYSDIRYVVQPVTYSLIAFYIVASFVGVILCSSVLIWKLNQRNRWLGSMSGAGVVGGDGGAGNALGGAGESEKSSKNVRDSQVIKMVLVVAIIFIVCFVPSLVYFFAIAMEQDLNMDANYQNLFILLTSISFTLNAINSSVNIFVYYRMSSKYKATFRSLFRMKPISDK